ncbi:MAG: hypothetical protein V7K69_22135 [Nostoc sp.]|uniref:hypothetical protein n=1 Tax=Nostoc sp. TaxID=1180 RepID=UPI002FF9274C
MKEKKSDQSLNHKNISVLSFGTMTFGGSEFFQEIGATQVSAIAPIYPYWH